MPHIERVPVTYQAAMITLGLFLIATAVGSTHVHGLSTYVIVLAHDLT